MKKIIYLFITTIVLVGCEKNAIGDFSPQEANYTQETRLDKKGIAYSYMAPRWSHKTSEIASHWFYHWGTDEREEIPSGIEHTPMFWGAGSVTDEKIQEMIQLKNEGKLHYILAFNEPDGLTQSNVSVDEAIALWPMLEQVGVPLVSPSVTGPGYKSDWLIEFMQRAEELNYRVDYIGYHNYPGPNAAQFIDRLRRTYEAFNRPIWITEFGVADWTATTDENNRYSPEEVLGFMQEVLPAMDGIDWIYRYAWFDDSDASRPQLASSRLFDADGNITPLGQFYAQHNPNAQIGPGTDTEYIPPLDDDELIFNGHFEGGTYVHDTAWQVWPNFPNGWEGYMADAVWVNETEPVTGFFSGKLRTNSSALIQLIPVQPGGTYTIKLFSKWKEATGTMKVVMRDTADNYRFFLSEALPQTTEWEESSFQVTMPDTTTEIKLVFWNDGPNMYMDDISLKLNE